MSNELVQSQPQMPAIFPTEQELKLLKEMGTTFLRSGLLPKAVDTPEKVILIMLKGRELGIPPLQALSGIYVVEGKTVMGGELMLSQIYKNVPGAKITFVQRDGKACVIEAARPGQPVATFSFSIEDANRAGLMGKGNWKSHPATMLQWRAVSNMAKALFSDAISGAYTPEELDVEVDSRGNFVNPDVKDPAPQKSQQLSEVIGLKKSEPKEVKAEVEAAPLNEETATALAEEVAGSFDSFGSAKTEFDMDPGKIKINFGRPPSEGGKLGLELEDLEVNEQEDLIKWFDFTAKKPLTSEMERVYAGLKKLRSTRSLGVKKSATEASPF